MYLFFDLIFGVFLSIIGVKEEEKGKGTSAVNVGVLNFVQS